VGQQISLISEQEEPKFIKRIGAAYESVALYGAGYDFQSGKSRENIQQREGGPRPDGYLPATELLGREALP
jgi:hypothetical protein